MALMPEAIYLDRLVMSLQARFSLMCTPKDLVFRLV